MNSENLGTIIIILILAVIVFFAFRSGIKHMKGQGGCCGGGGDVKPKKKKLQGKCIYEKIVFIEGMHCDHCKNSVESQINQIDGAAAKVDLKKKLAVVSVSRQVDDSEIKAAVEKAGFKVTSIETKNI